MRLSLVVATAVAAAAGVWMLGATASAQQAGETGFMVQRTAWGAPDLQGVWTNSSITRLTRPRGVDSLVLTPEQAKALEDNDFNNIRTKAELNPTDPSEGAPEKGKPLPPVGNYNAVWVDPGAHVARVRGELRSSWITEPANGQVPYSQQGRRDLADRGRISGDEGYDGPESRSPGERCLVGFGGTGGPVMLNVLYNNTYQIVQSPDHVMILVEMVHDARIVRMEGAFRPPELSPWLGDSIGRWEGDTLVVETRNLHPQQRGQVMLSPGGRLTERFTRVADGEILYSFEVDDPTYYSQVWRGEIPFRATPEAVYEYACHEGNYGLEGILAGARVQERNGTALEQTPDSE
ncbi:hypothetical protein GC169_08925 [bacterium]|nr:hypothetical protein [bacterium]